MSRSRYWLEEARASLSRIQPLGLLAGALLLAASSVVLPWMPDQAIELLRTAFQLDRFVDVVLINDYLAVQVVIFWIAAAELLRVLVAPREEHQLDLLLSKPIPRAEWLLARVLPVLAAAVAGTLVLGAVTVVAVLPWLDAAALASIAGATVWLALLLVLQLALLVPVLLFVRETFHGLLAAFALWMMPMLGMPAFIYRPDLFDGQPLLQMLAVYPANLVWGGGLLVPLAAVGLPVGALVVATLLGGATAAFRRQEVA